MSTFKYIYGVKCLQFLVYELLSKLRLPSHSILHLLTRQSVFSNLMHPIYSAEEAVLVGTPITVKQTE